jgi:hypothetical protein
MEGRRIPQNGDPVPPFTAEHAALRARARQWIEAELLPHAGA